MKKIILVAAMVLGFAAAAVAQPRAVGVRLGNNNEISYQHNLGTNFLEVDGGFGIDFYNNASLSIGATGIYNYMIAQPQWTDMGEWGFYAGPGASIGVGLGETSHFNLAAAGAVGLEYTFWFPLQLSIDLRQNLGYSIGAQRFYAPTSIGISARYRF